MGKAAATRAGDWSGRTTGSENGSNGSAVSPGGPTKCAQLSTDGSSGIAVGVSSESQFEADGQQSFGSNRLVQRRRCPGGACQRQRDRSIELRIDPPADLRLHHDGELAAGLVLDGGSAAMTS
jgi:hypothetical protein